MPRRPDGRAPRPQPGPRRAAARALTPRRPTPDDRFFRQLVSSMRNGVIANHRDGLLRRQVPDSPDAQSLLADIISESKLANAIVVEMLEFVRPIRLQMEQTDIRDVLQQSVTLAEGKATRGDISLQLDLDPDLPMIHGDFHQLCQLFSNLLINAFEALEGRGRIAIRAAAEAVEPDPAFSIDAAASSHAVVVDVIDNGPGVPSDLSDRIFVPFFTTKPKG